MAADDAAFGLDADVLLADPEARRASLTDLLGAVSVDVLMSQLPKALEAFGIAQFALFTIEGYEARLAFARNSLSVVELSDRRIDLQSCPVLWDFMMRGGAQLNPGEISPQELSFVPELRLDAATSIFRLAGHEPVGFLVVYGLVPAPLLRPPLLDDFLTLMATFATVYYKAQMTDSMAMAYRRTCSKLQELQEAESILLLSSQQEVYDAVLKRVLNTVGSKSGILFLKKGASFNVSHLVGAPTTEGMSELDRVVAAAVEKGRVSAVNALSGEEIVAFDVSTIHMASAAVFPLKSKGQVSGAVAAFDATVSQDAIDIIEGTLLVGSTAIENWRARSKMLEQERMKGALEIAAETQQRLLPEGSLDVRNLDVFHFSQYCEGTGGDYVDHYRHENSRYLSVCVGDVSGHGIGSALLMVDVRARLRTFLSSELGIYPHEILHRINQVLSTESGPEQFITLFLATIDTATGVARYASAGHEPPLVLRSETGEWDELPSTGLPLGMDEDAEYRLGVAFFQAGDIVVLSTDGGPECTNHENKQFGIEPIKETVERLADQPAQVIVDALVRRTVEHNGSQSFLDDVTYSVVKVEHTNLRMSGGAPETEGEILREVTFKSTRAEKEVQLDALMGFLRERYAEWDLNGVFMAAEEALTNAVVHGNKELEERSVHVQVIGNDGVLNLLIRNEGDGFVPESQIPNFQDADALFKESGRGLTMMITLMDRVTYWDSGRAVCLTKKAEEGQAN